MQKSRILSCNCIKLNATTVVKPAFLNRKAWRISLWLTFTLSVLLSQKLSWSDPTASSSSQEEQSLDSDPPPEPEDNEVLPDIIAKSFAVKVLDRSQSNRIYLFEDLSQSQLEAGRILLLKREDESIMAFRVLKSYPEKNAFAAKRVRRYKHHRILENGEAFAALEKISDKNIATTPQDKNDLEELEQHKIQLKAMAYDPELDEGTSPVPENENDKKYQEENSSEVDDLEQNTVPETSIEEPGIIDHYVHWLSAGIGFIKNNNSPTTGGTHYYSSGNLKYGISLGRLLFLDQPQFQDSLTLEVGISLYKALNYTTLGDAYGVTGLMSSLRYNIFFSESLALFFYSGVLVNRVISSTQGNNNSKNALEGIFPAGGIGFLFQVGPSWYTRFDIGYESVFMGLVLHF